MGFLRKAATEAGIPVLVNIHDVVMAKEFVDRMIGIANGRVVFDGPPAALTADIQRLIYRRVLMEGESATPVAVSAPMLGMPHPRGAAVGDFLH